MFWVYSFLIGFVIGVFLDILIAFFSRDYSLYKRPHHFIVKKISFHHSNLGILAFILSFFFYSLILIGFGFGIILSHTYREGSLLFIEKGKSRYF